MPTQKCHPEILQASEEVNYQHPNSHSAHFWSAFAFILALVCLPFGLWKLAELALWLFQ